jgi:hypothetical protein
MGSPFNIISNNSPATLPVDAGRIGAYGPSVTVLRDFVRSSRQPL